MNHAAGYPYTATLYNRASFRVQCPEFGVPSIYICRGKAKETRGYTTRDTVDDTRMARKRKGVLASGGYLPAIQVYITSMFGEPFEVENKNYILQRGNINHLKIDAS
jgi:hypothetical protein